MHTEEVTWSRLYLGPGNRNLRRPPPSICGLGGGTGPGRTGVSFWVPQKGGGLRHTQKSGHTQEDGLTRLGVLVVVVGYIHGGVVFWLQRDMRGGQPTPGHQWGQWGLLYVSAAEEGR